jgi:hypothetical protein
MASMSSHDSGGPPPGRRDARARSNSWALDMDRDPSDGGGSVEGEGAVVGEAEKWSIFLEGNGERPGFDFN